MKCTIVLMLAFCLQVSARSYSQTVSVNLRNVSMEKALKEIGRQSGYHVFYKLEQLKNANAPVSIKADKKDVRMVLDELFKSQPLQYHITNETIVVSPKEEKKPLSLAEGLSPRLESPVPPVVRGRITNEKGEPVAGVSISIKGGKVIGVTGDNGEFVLNNVADNAVLVFSAVSIETFETKLNGRSELALNAKFKVSQLEEVVVNKGYYTEKQKLSVGNTIRIDGKDIEKQPVTNPLLALEGQVPGLFVTQSSGVPGSGVTVRIQGQNTISGVVGSDPLYVIDGVPYTSQLLPNIANILRSSGGPITNGSPAGSGNALSYLNPADIESIEILKDADATAIYGSRAANGAILITTKKGKAGQLKVGFNAQYGFGKVTKMLPMLNTQQYLEVRREAKKNDNLAVAATDYDINGFWDTTRNTDWQKALIGGTAMYSDYQGNVSGGNALTQYLIGAGYHKETTVFPTDAYDQKTSVHFNVNTTSQNQKFRLQFSGSYLFDNNHLFQTDPVTASLQIAPDAPALRNADGSLNWAQTSSGTSTWSNPLAPFLVKYRNRTASLIANTVMSYEIAKGLSVRTNIGFNNLSVDEFSPNPLSSKAPESRATAVRTASYSNSDIKSWIVEPQVDYKTRLWKGNFNMLVGTTIQQNNSNYKQLLGVGYNSDNVLENIQSASTVIVNGTGISVYKYNALYGRLNYEVDNKYIINLTARRDGSSRFGPENRFHNFGSVGAGWIFSNEHFLKTSFLSFGKLKASYGTTGNDQIGDYQYLNLYNSVSYVAPYQGISVLQVNGLPNPYLAWEETRKFQAGLDLGFFNDRLQFSASYLQNRSSSLLLSYSLPVYTGVGAIIENFPATIQNSSWEFVLGSKNINIGKVKWSSSFNLTIPRNKLIAFPNIENTGYFGNLFLGEPTSVRLAYHFAGVDPATGLNLFGTTTGANTSSPNFSKDRMVHEDLTPRFYGGLSNTFTYKSLQLDFIIQYTKQVGPNYRYGNGYPVGYFNKNFPTTVLNRWQKAGDVADIQKYSSTFTYFSSAFNMLSSDAGYSDASFIRLRNISLAWSLPQQVQERLHLQNTRVFIAAQNLLTVTNYAGLDPENQTVNAIPPLRIITFGLKLEIK